MKPINPKFAFGDRVYVAGYWPRVFQVDGYRREDYAYPNEQWTELVYELHDVVTAEWLEADESDLTPAGEQAFDATDLIVGIDFATLFQPRKPTARELAERRKTERQERVEQIDNLLDMREWYRKAMERTNDEAYGARIMAIDAELKKLVGKE
ncbi:hypothetical protein PZE06_21415 [Robertmurraya sp. DFI.2.37]|uniref:hypothetical protein n=1 Tax=Robertmurraya sp. DFI.2.37 TaxID=3031819 RepID=UPI0012455369|nr:hypothetical protein [Robertmurraya sp. DFI.2.37]MDF1510698.1 hypothetical protein [Robertmurraya sp. DFI.2.37]